MAYRWEFDERYTIDDLADFHEALDVKIALMETKGTKP